MTGMIRLYKNVRLSRSSAIEGINFGSPAEVPELQASTITQVN
jgi:hypothetical protein